MAEITYLPEVECAISNPNATWGTQIIYVTDVTGNQQYMRVGQGAVKASGGKTYLGVGVISVDYKTKRALIELPQEADSGTRRLWVSVDQFRRQAEAS